MAQAPVLALDIGGSKVAAALVVGGQVLELEQTPTPAIDGPEAVVAAARIVAGRLLARAPRAPSALGVACAGLVSGGTVRALSADLLRGWHAYPLAARLQEAFALPAALINDAQAAAYGEAAYGAGRGKGSLLFVTVSTGVGGGVVLGGKPWRGANGMAGHLGQVGGRALERVTSGTALAVRASELGHPVGAREVIAAAQAGEVWARGLLTDAAEALAAALVDAKYLLDPEVVVLGGGVGLNPGFELALRSAFEGVEATLRTPVLRAELGAAAGLVGAAAWALSSETSTPP